VHLLSRNPVPVLWKVATRFSRFAPIVAKLKLQSKTIADFNAIRYENRL
jgi:hypothetical protein